MSHETRKPIAVSELLEQHQGLLKQLRAGASTADRTLQALRAHLPEELSGQVWGASVRDGTLTVLVRSAGWGTRLRYHAPRCRDALARDLGQAIERVTVKVRPAG